MKKKKKVVDKIQFPIEFSPSIWVLEYVNFVLILWSSSPIPISLSVNIKQPPFGGGGEGVGVPFR